MTQNKYKGELIGWISTKFRCKDKIYLFNLTILILWLNVTYFDAFLLY